MTGNSSTVTKRSPSYAPVDEVPPHSEALSEAERLRTRWRENRLDSPDLFDDEMADAIDRICKKPGIGSVHRRSPGRPSGAC